MSLSAICQLAGDWRGAVPSPGVMVEQKIDGWRALHIRAIDGKTGLWTRNGHPIEGVAHILYRLAEMERAAGEPMVFDGEFQVGGTLAATKAWCESGWKIGGEAGVLHLFDCLTLAEWRAGGTDTPLYRRKARLQELAAEADKALSWEWRPGSRGRDEGQCPVHILPDEWAATRGDVEVMARRVWAEGGEGLMLKDVQAPYRRGRNAAWMKVKQENAAKWR